MQRVSKRGRNPQRWLTGADAIDFFLDCQFVETCKRQIEEKTDAAFKQQVGIPKSTFDLLRSTLGQRGIGNTPMRGHGLAGPDGTGFLRRVVANGKDKIHFGRCGLGELFPAFAAQAFRRQVRHFNQLQRFGAHHSRRVTSGAKSGENRLAFAVENGFGHDGTRGIACAQE
jgi:hypothetical protein